MLAFAPILVEAVDEPALERPKPDRLAVAIAFAVDAVSLDPPADDRAVARK